MSRIRTILSSLNPDRVHNIRVITLSILAAATFWFLNALNDTYSTTIQFPIEILFDSEQYIATEELPDELQINVSGLGWNLFRSNLGLNTTPIQFRPENPAEIKKIPSGALLGTVTDQMNEFNVNFILTDTLYINIDKKITRSFMLSVDSTTISLEKGFWLSSTIKKSPDSVSLLGPESILMSLGDTIAVQIPQDEIDENYAEDIPIEVPNVNLIVRNPPTVSVAFDIEEFKRVTREWPVSLMNFPNDSSAVLSQDQVSVSYDIGFSNEDKVDSLSIRVEADFETLNLEDSTITPIVLNSTAFIKNLSLDSGRIKIIYREK